MRTITRLARRFSGVDVDAFAPQPALGVLRTLVGELTPGPVERFTTLAAPEDVKTVAGTCFVIIFAWNEKEKVRDCTVLG